jgi:hypothetical protein
MAAMLCPGFWIPEPLDAVFERKFHQWLIGRPVPERIHPRLVAHQHPEGSAGHLRPNRRTGRVGFVHRCEPVPPIVGILFVDHRKEGQRYPVPPAEPGDPVDFGVDRVALVAAHGAAHPSRNHLQHTGTRLRHNGHQCGQLLLFGVGARHGFTRRAAVPGSAPEGHAQGAGPQAFGDYPAHRVEVHARRGVVRAVTHDEAADRRMRNLSTHVHRARHPLEGIQVLAEGLPLPGDALR